MICPTPRTNGLRLAVTALMASFLLLSGCAPLQKVSVEKAPAEKAPLLSEPVIDKTLSQDDFGFPSSDPSLVQGKQVFDANCSSCHAASYWQNAKVQTDLAYTTPIDLFLMLSRGEAPKVVYPTPERRQVLPAKHPAFRDKLSRDERWASIFYARYLAGAADIQDPPGANTKVDAIFGGNCAVCHGKRGFGDGPLHVGKTGNHEVANAEVAHNLLPVPANFNEYSRLYNRTDAQLHKYICEGIYPSAMPSWYGNVHRDSKTGQVVYVFDARLISSLVRHVRTFTYNNDLPESQSAPKGLSSMAACHPTRTNRPWTALMRQAGGRSAEAEGVQQGGATH